MEILENVKNTAMEAAENIQYYFEGETITTRKKIIATCTTFALAGIVLGFLISPIKKGVYFNIFNNGNYAKPKNGQPGTDNIYAKTKKQKCGSKKQSCKKLK